MIRSWLRQGCSIEDTDFSRDDMINKRERLWHSCQAMNLPVRRLGRHLAIGLECHWTASKSAGALTHFRLGIIRLGSFDDIQAGVMRPPAALDRRATRGERMDMTRT